MLKLCLQNFSLNHDHDHDHEENIWSRTITITTTKKVSNHARSRVIVTVFVIVIVKSTITQVTSVDTHLCWWGGVTGILIICLHTFLLSISGFLCSLSLLLFDSLSFLSYVFVIQSSWGLHIEQSNKAEASHR